MAVRAKARNQRLSDTRLDMLNLQPPAVASNSYEIRKSLSRGDVRGQGNIPAGSPLLGDLNKKALIRKYHSQTTITNHKQHQQHQHQHQHQQRDKNFRDRAPLFGRVIAISQKRSQRPEGAAIMSQEPHARLKQQQQHMAATLPPSPAASTTTRPAALHLHSSFGYTAIDSADLKRRICDSRPADSSATLLQVPLDNRTPLPPTPTTPFTIMGNKPSSISSSPLPDDSSLRSVMRRSSRQQPMPRKGSFNVFKRIDSKSPLSRDVTASVMSVLHRDGQKQAAARETEDADDLNNDGQVGDSAVSFSEQSEKHESHYPDMYPKVHSASTITMTEDRAAIPLSAATTIRDSRSNDQSTVAGSQTDGAFDQRPRPLLPRNDNAFSPVSPTIPAPSPLPEDSPHKYGLRDKMDTPDLPDRSEDINVPKIRRKSSGVEIFNEAKSLQSAQSFLNGLSTSRRRAESASAMRMTDGSESTNLGKGRSISRPASARPLSTQSHAMFHDREGLRKGHNFKSSGFAYSRPLTLNQIKCYRGHARLLPSRNQHAPVECAVCHIDDDAEHFSCSFCALRMCRYCREDFTKNGLAALRERVRKAELGLIAGRHDSANSSSESIYALKKSKSTSFA